MGARSLFIDETTPNARAIMRIMENRLGGEGRITAQAIEQTRQDLNRLYSAAQRSGGPDQIVMGEVKGAFDEWLDGLFTNALMDGDPGILATAKEARGLWREFKSKFFSQGKTDDAGKLPEKVVEMDATPKEVADMLFGASAVGERGVSARLAARLKRALPAEAFDEIRSGAFLKAVEPPAGKQWGYERIANRLEAFVSGEGSALARQLYSADEIAQMKRFAGALKLMVPPKSATNPSGTGYAMARLGGDIVRSFMTSLGLGVGGPSGGLAAILAQSATGAARGAASASAIPATRPLVVQIPPRLAAGVPVGSAVSATEALGAGR